MEFSPHKSRNSNDSEGTVNARTIYNSIISNDNDKFTFSAALWQQSHDHGKRYCVAHLTSVFLATNLVILKNSALPTCTLSLTVYLEPAPYPGLLPVHTAHASPHPTSREGCIGISSKLFLFNTVFYLDFSEL